MTIVLGLEAVCRCADGERVMQRHAVLAKLGLPTDQYLTLARSLPSSLLAAAAVCLMPDAQAYELLNASEMGTAEAGEAPKSDATASLDLNEQHASHGRVPGTVEVRAAPASQQQGTHDLFDLAAVLMVL